MESVAGMNPVFLFVGVPVAIIATVVLVTIGLWKFERRTSAKFGRRFFRIWKILIMGIGTFLLEFSLHAMLYKGQICFVRLATGVVLIGIVVSWNIRKTNIFFGIAGSVIELALSPTVLMAAMTMLILSILMCGASLPGALGDVWKRIVVFYD